MLTHPTLDKLQALRLTGMVKGFEEQTADDRPRGAALPSAWGCSSMAR
jgi:hypothetical protein